MFNDKNILSEISEKSKLQKQMLHDLLPCRSKPSLVICAWKRLE